MFLLLAGFACAAIMAPGCADEIYRWMDAQGRVHFGDTPPDEGAERLDLAPAPAADPQLQRRRERGQQLLEIMAEDREMRDEEKRDGEQAAADRHAKCERARQHLSRVARAAYIYQQTADPANPRILEEMERQQFEQELRAEVHRHCDQSRVPE